MILFIYGPDSYTSQQKINQLKEKFAQEVDSSGLNLNTIDGSKVTKEQLQQELTASGFMADKRMIIIKNLVSKGTIEIKKFFQELIKKKNDNIIVVYETESLKASGLTTALKKLQYAQECPAPTPQQIIHFILTEVPKRGGSISQSDAQYLSTRIPTSLWDASNEIDKLLAFSQTTPISKDAINKLTQPQHDDDIFRFVDAIATKNKKEALQLLHDQFGVGANEMYLLSMITRQFRILIQIKDALDTHPTQSSNDLAHLIGIHPFVAKKSLPQAERFTSEYLKSIYRYLLGLDTSFKNSFATPKTLLDTFIVKI